MLNIHKAAVRACRPHSQRVYERVTAVNVFLDPAHSSIWSQSSGIGSSFMHDTIIAFCVEQVPVL